MLDIVDRTELNLEAPGTTKRERVETELRTNSARSDREIGRICGVDGKTVAAARSRLGLSDSGVDETASNRGHMLTEGCKDFDNKHPAETAEEVVDNAVAKGVVSLAPQQDDDLCWVIPHQARIECYRTADGSVEIWQEGAGPSEDVRIGVASRNVVALARRLLWAAGFNSIGIYAYRKGGGCVDLDDGDEPFCVQDERPGYGPVG